MGQIASEALIERLADWGVDHWRCGHDDCFASPHCLP
jgi:hypothetical protein